MRNYNAYNILLSTIDVDKVSSDSFMRSVEKEYDAIIEDVVNKFQPDKPGKLTDRRKNINDKKRLVSDLAIYFNFIINSLLDEESKVIKGRIGNYKFEIDIDNLSRIRIISPSGGSMYAVDGNDVYYEFESEFNANYSYNNKDYPVVYRVVQTSDKDVNLYIEFDGDVDNIFDDSFYDENDFIKIDKKNIAKFDINYGEMIFLTAIYRMIPYSQKAIIKEEFTYSLNLKPKESYFNPYMIMSTENFVDLCSYLTDAIKMAIKKSYVSKVINYRDKKRHR